MNHRAMMMMMMMVLLLAAAAGPAAGEPEAFDAADSAGVEAAREGRFLYLQVEAGVDGPISVPRLAAPLRGMRWDGEEMDAGLMLKPGQERWEISWKQRPVGRGVLVLEFDAAPVLMSEVGPIEAAGDGSFFLPAHLAVTEGEKVRYEPQPNKNTVGFWTGAKDSATWTINVQEPGRYNVAVLQGCGRGQGGSTGVISFDAAGGETGDAVALEFVVEETGHFQNFRWRHLGEIELTQVGEVRVRVGARQISKAALMDVRAVQLVRLPG